MRKVILYLLAFTILLLAGCSDLNNALSGDNAQFVRSTAAQLNNHKDISNSLYAGSSSLYRLNSLSLFEPYFRIRDLKAEVDKDDKTIVHYSCKIPGLVGAVFNMVYERCFLLNDDYSAPVEIEGDLKIITNEWGTREIDISGDDNVFSVYASMRHANPLFLSTLIDNSNNGTLDAFLNLETVLYAGLTGRAPEEYMENTVEPELENYIANLETISASVNRQGYSIQDRSAYWAKTHTTAVYIMVAGAILIPFAAAVCISMIRDARIPVHDRKALREKWQKRIKGYDSTQKRQLQQQRYKPLLKDDKTNDTGWRVAAVRDLVYPRDREFLIFLIKEDNETEVRKEALRMLPYPEEKVFLSGEAYEPFGNRDIRSAALEKFQYPADRELILKCLKHIVYNEETEKKILGQMSYPDHRDDLTDLARSGVSESLCAEIIRHKLPYPEEADTFTYLLDNRSMESVKKAVMEIIDRSADRQKKYAQIAISGKDAADRLNALKKLDYSQYPEVFRHAAQKDSAAQNRFNALKKLDISLDKEIFQQTAQQDSDAGNRRFALEKLDYPEDRNILSFAAKNDKDRDNRRIARRKLPYFLEEAEAYAHPDLLDDQKFSSGEKNATETERLKGSVALFKAPHCSEEIMRHLCRRIQAGINQDAAKDAVTLAGWSAAALGKVLSGEMKPEEIVPNRERFKLAVDHHNEIVSRIQEVQEKIKQINLSHFEDMEHPYLTYEEQETFKEYTELCEELDRGMGNFMLDNGDHPFTYLLQLMQDGQIRLPRFIKQGIIMGLLDWLIENAEHPEAKSILERVVAVRAELIRSDNDLSFFEVRVPKDCTREEYAELFSLVLHSANPSVKFCDTQKLLELAEKEVPGCMEMLRNYPLRLIDPVNRGTLGFYKFEPFVHVMWLQYEPPMNSGKVISRYHEVDDRTLPLSSGLNLQLFRDIYSVIPTLFHEYQHFKGDPNEASVFLKTQVFSISFYQRHKSAKASRDAVFARMGELLGQPPAADKCTELNALIEKYYGKEIPEKEASAHAEQEILALNEKIQMTNMLQKWDPAVKYPLFTKDEDSFNRDLILDIIVRWDMTPKSITEKEFRKILSDAG